VPFVGFFLRVFAVAKTQPKGLAAIRSQKQLLRSSFPKAGEDLLSPAFGSQNYLPYTDYTNNS
jgi:hypothetical protein